MGGPDLPGGLAMKRRPAVVVMSRAQWWALVVLAAMDAAFLAALYALWRH